MLRPRAFGPLCRPEVGVPSRPRAFSRSAVRGSRPCGPRCRPEVGVPSRPPRFLLGRRYAVRGPAARGADRRSAFQAVPAPFLGRRYAVRGPAGRGADRRSAFQAVPRAFFSVSGTQFAALRAAVPTGGRRSKPSPRFLLGRRYAVRVPAAPSGPRKRTTGSELRSLPACSGESVKGGKFPLSQDNNDQSELAAARRRCAREFRLPARSAGRIPDGARRCPSKRSRATPSRGPVRDPLDGWMRGLEPPTTGTTIRCSAIELHPPPNRGNGGRLARQGGFEPPTRGLEGRRSILLSYWRSRAS